MDSTTVCDTSKIRRPRHAWPWPRHAQSDCESECSKQKLKLELLRGSRPKPESLPVSVVVHEHLVRAGCMFIGTTKRRTLTRLHRISSLSLALRPTSCEEREIRALQSTSTCRLIRILTLRNHLQKRRSLSIDTSEMSVQHLIFHLSITLQCAIGLNLETTCVLIFE